MLFAGGRGPTRRVRRAAAPMRGSGGQRRGHLQRHQQCEIGYVN